MIISGFLTHNLYTQTGNFSFISTLSFSNQSGQSEFGFSGDTSKINFSFISGKVIDWNNNFVGTYNDMSTLTVSGVVGIFTIDYYINNEPVAFGMDKPTGYFNKIYTNAQNQNFDFNLFIQGDVPNYIIPQSSIFGTGNALVPITITNNSNFPFEIFSGNVNSSKFSLASGLTGYVNNTFTFNLIPSGISSIGLNQMPINLYTNFGLVSTNISMSGF